jgi:hypothetical protein
MSNTNPPNSTNPINDITIAELTEIQTSITTLQQKLDEIKNSVSTQQNSSLPNLSAFKTDISHVIQTIDTITQNDGTPLLIYVTSLIKDMINNNDNLFYEKQPDGSINVTNRLRGEFDILNIFADHNNLKTKFLDKLNDFASMPGTYPNLTPEKKEEIKEVLDKIIL